MMTDRPEQQQEIRLEEARQRYQLEKTKPGMVHNAIVADGERELKRGAGPLLASGFAAGLSMSLSFLTEGILAAHLPDASWRPLVSKLGYPVGFLVVVLGRQQLFTENTLTGVLPVLENCCRPRLLQLFRLWVLVLLANIAGAALAAWYLGNTDAVSGNVQRELSRIGHEVLSATPGTQFVRAIVAVWIIALVVWVTSAMKSGELWAVAILTYVVGAGAFTHVVVGSVEMLFLVLTGVAPVATFLQQFLAPALAGNILGGVALVAALNHGQAAPENQETEPLH